MLHLLEWVFAKTLKIHHRVWGRHCCRLLEMPSSPLSVDNHGADNNLTTLVDDLKSTWTNGLKVNGLRFWRGRV